MAKQRSGGSPKIHKLFEYSYHPVFVYSVSVCSEYIYIYIYIYYIYIYIYIYKSTYLPISVYPIYLPM